MLAQQGKNVVPHYKAKYPRTTYLQKGDPLELDEDCVRMELPTIYTLSKEEMDLWSDAKDGVINKNKKKDFMILVDPPLKRGHLHVFKIEVLHKDYQGFQYTATGNNETEVNRRFWPIVQKLLAKYCGPKVVRPPVPYQNN